MKNKKVLYFLFPATLIVWITIFVRIYNTLNPTSEIKISTLNDSKEVQASQMVSDTFSIDNNYRDPFVGDKIILKTNNASSNNFNPIKPVVPIPKKESLWPKILYLGMIKNQKSNKQLVLVQINDNLETMKIGDLNNNIQVCKIFKDSIEVMFGKQKKFIRK
jgi:hypothetical protein